MGGHTSDDADRGAQQPETIAERLTGVRRWLFLTGNRLIVAAAILVVVYALLATTDVVVGAIDQEQTQPLFYLFSALVGGTFTLVTIIISIAQVVISRQLGTPGELNDQIQATNAYRESIEESIDADVLPVTPTDFLQLLLHSSAGYIDALDIETEEGDADAWTDLRETVAGMEQHVDAVDSELGQSDLGIFSALAVTIDGDYSRDIYRLRRLQSTYGDVYPESVRDRLDNLVVRLQQIDIARQYLKTLYVQHELSRLSRHLLYVGLPAVVVSVLMLRLFAVGYATFSPADLFAFVPVAIAIALSPLAVLFSYVLRLSIVAQRTIAITPFTLPVEREAT